MLFLLFAIGKFYFFFINAEEVSVLVFGEILLHGLRLDLAMIGYTLLLPLLLGILHPLLPRIIRQISRVYWWFVGAVFILILATDPFFYSYWGQKTNLGFMQFIGKETAGITSIAASDAIIAVVFLGGSLVLYARWMLPRLVVQSRVGVVSGILLIGLSVVLLRGGIGNVPINVSSAYYSKVDLRNNTAVNSIWNFMATELERDKHSALVFFTAEELLEKQAKYATSIEPVYASDLLAINDSTHVLLIVLESFSAKVVGSLNGGRYGVTPQLDAIAKEGISYSRAYASSFRSDKGLLALTYGIPSGARQTLTNFPAEIGRYPSIFAAFPSYYHTSFAYGGNLEFANIKVLFKDASKVKTENDYATSRKNVWGAHDEVVFTDFVAEYAAEPKPQFKMLFSLSSHEPFDVPDFDKHSNRYLNSIAYTDSCLGSMIAQLKKTGKWANTLLVLTADHGTVRPDNPPLYDTSNFRIPLILAGGVVTQRDTVITSTVSQLDLMSTLGMLFSENKSVGRSILAPRGRAFYSFHNGITYVTDTTLNYWDIGQKRYLQAPEAPPLEKVYYQTENEKFFGVE